MTNVDVDYDDLLDLVGTRLSIEQVVDRITMMGSGPEGIQGNVMTFDIFPNRADMYSVEGIARALRGYLGLEAGLPPYPVEASGIEFRVESSVKAVRPIAVGGVVRGIELEESLLKSLVDLQEKLHLTLGRRRRKVAIGIHDLDKVVPPFTYRAVRPDSIRFRPLGLAEELDLRSVLDRHEKGREYGHLVADKPGFPVILDANGTVMSFPPIINGVTTELTRDTRNLFVDVTGTEADAVNGALNILVASLAERRGRIESARMVYEDRTISTPDLSPRPHRVDLNRANGLLGLNLSPGEAVDLLRRMRYDARADGSVLHVMAPAYRTDILHEVDIVEDLAIAWGYDRYPPTLPTRQTLGQALPVNEFCDALRVLLIGYGYQEVLSLTMASADSPFAAIERVRLANPVTEDLTTLRASLVPALLNVLRLNKHRELPQRIFEIGDVVVGGRNVRHAAGASIHPKASFTEAKSLTLSVLRDLGSVASVEGATDEDFIPGRVADALVEGRAVARFGEIHPRILEAHGLVQPVAALSLNLDSLAIA